MAAKTTAHPFRSERRSGQRAGSRAEEALLDVPIEGGVDEGIRAFHDESRADVVGLAVLVEPDVPNLGGNQQRLSRIRAESDEQSFIDTRRTSCFQPEADAAPRDVPTDGPFAAHEADDHVSHVNTLGRPYVARRHDIDNRPRWAAHEPSAFDFGILNSLFSRLTVAAAAFCSACGAEGLEVLSAPPGAESVIVAISHAGSTQVFGGDAGEFGIEVELDEGDPIFVAYYATKLSEHDVIVPKVAQGLGQLDLAPEGHDLLDFIDGAAWRRQWGDESWTPTMSVPPAFATVRLKKTAECRRATTSPIGSEIADCATRPARRVVNDAPDPPSDPEMPSFSCTGDTTMHDAGIEVCLPYAPATPDCPPGARVDVTAGTCVPVGRTTCSWPALPADTVYVDPTAATGGDGGLDRPYRALDEALAHVPRPSTIALASGTIVASTISIDAATTIEGLCAAETKLVLSGPLGVDAPLRLSNLDLEAPLVRAPAPLEIEGARVVLTGELQSGADLTIRDSLFEANAPILTFVSTNGGTATIDETTFEGAGLRMANMANVSMSRSVVRGLEGVHPALEFSSCASATLRELVVEDALGRGVFVAGSELAIHRVSIRDIGQRNEDDLVGIALEVASSTLTGSRLSIADVHYAGLRFGSSLGVLTDVVIDGVRRSLPGLEARGLEAASSSVTIDGLRIERAALQMAADLPGHVTIRNFVFDGTPDLRSSGSVAGGQGANVRLERGTIRHASQRGINLHGAGTYFAIQDVTIDGVVLPPTSTLDYAAGIIGGSGARMDAERVRVADVPGVGVFVGNENTLASFTDVQIANVSQTILGVSGSCMFVGDEAHIRILRGAMRGCAERGIHTSGGDLTLDHVRIDVVPRRAGIEVFSEAAVHDDQILEMRDVWLQGTAHEGQPVRVEGSDAAFSLRHTSLLAERLTIRDADGWGLWIDNGVTPVRTATISGLDIEGTRGTALIMHTGSKATIDGARIVDTLAGASGAAAVDSRNSDFVLTNFEVRENDVSGLRIGRVGIPQLPVYLGAGRIEDNPIGMEALSEDTVDFVVEHVFFEGNDQNFIVP